MGTSRCRNPGERRGGRQGARRSQARAPLDGGGEGARAEARAGDLEWRGCGGPRVGRGSPGARGLVLPLCSPVPTLPLPELGSARRVPCYLAAAS